MSEANTPGVGRFFTTGHPRGSCLVRRRRSTSRAKCLPQSAVSHFHESGRSAPQIGAHKLCAPPSVSLRMAPRAPGSLARSVNSGRP
jgi:hypothetical protein